MPTSSEVTGLLIAWNEGNDAARDRLIEVVYAELKQLAKAYLRRELAHNSVAATTLVHEAYLRLVDQRRVQWTNRSHFFGIAAQAMRRILVDRARARLAAKRGGGAVRIASDDLELPTEPAANVDVLALDEALSRLEAIDPRWSRLVELRYFAGLTVEETAAVLNVSAATVKSDWRLARAWLFRELRGGTAATGSSPPS
jgi:RNA polymerase sigma-70 factor, ECF subfamily